MTHIFVLFIVRIVDLYKLGADPGPGCLDSKEGHVVFILKKETIRGQLEVN